MHPTTGSASKWDYRFGAFPLLGGGLGWGLIYYRVRFYEPKIESCFKAASRCNYQFAVITRNVSDEVIQLNNNLWIATKIIDFLAMTALIFTG